MGATRVMTTWQRTTAVEPGLADDRVGPRMITEVVLPTGWVVHGFVQPPLCLAAKTVLVPTRQASPSTAAVGVGKADVSSQNKEEQEENGIRATGKCNSNGQFGGRSVAIVC